MGDHIEFDWESAYADGHVESPLDLHIVDLASTLDGGTAIDLGCGAGQNSIWLAKQGWKVTGVDIAPSAIAQAREEAVDAGVSVEFLVEDLVGWTSRATFDLVVSTYALPPRGPGRTRMLDAAVTSVAPGGTIVVTEFDRSITDLGGWAMRDTTDIDELAAHLDGLHVARLEVETTHHAHGHAEQAYPVVVAVARQPDQRSK